MEKLALLHRAKSEYAYAYDKDTLHILIRTAKNDFKQVNLIYGDPFEWHKNEHNKFDWSHRVEPMVKRYQTSLFDYYFIAIKQEQKRVKYAFVLYDDDGIHLYGTRNIIRIRNESDLYRQYDLSDYFNFPFIHEIDMHQTPTWVKDIVWYQIFPDRFYGKDNQSKLKWGNLPVKNNEFYGGNLQGIIEKLPYLHELGITGIYFTPIFESPSAHKYDTTNYYKIDPQFGTEEDLKQLVKKAHNLNIKVMLDGVFNHTGIEHEFFQDVLKHGKSSKYYNCFYIDQYPIDTTKKHTKLDYKAFAFAPAMPKWRTEDPYASEYLLGCIKYWIETCDIDGWRLDVSNEISHDFLRKIKKAARSVKKEVFILGENLDDSTPWLQGDQLDAVMNYDFSYPTWQFFEGHLSLSAFQDTIEAYLAKTPKNIMPNMFNLVGCHDTIRIKHRLNEDTRRVKLIYLWMFTSAGNPNIYYGDEIGMTGAQDPDNRRCMIWDESKHDFDLKHFIQKLIKLRIQYPVLLSTDYNFMSSEVLAFTKSDDKDDILVIINQGKFVDLNIEEEYRGQYINLLDDSKVNIHDKITLKPYEYLLLKKGE